MGKSLFTCMPLLAGLLASTSLKGQMITASSVSGPGNNPLTYDTSNPTTGTPYPYWAQFGVSGTSTGPTLVNVESGASSAVTVSSISQSADSVASRTQSTSGIYFQYDNDSTPGSLSNADGTSPQSSATTISSPYLSGESAPAGDISVQTGHGAGAPGSGQTLTFSITFNEAVTEGTLNLVANNWASTSTFTFTFTNGATASIDDPLTPPASGNDNEIYDLSFADVPEGSVLTVTDVMQSTIGPAANTSITGIAFTTLDVPEPSTYLLMFGAAAMLLGFVRLRHRVS